MTVEVTTKYATTVDELSQAWSFIMERLDELGDSPSISITPYWVVTAADETPRRFEVVVSAMREE